MQKNIKNTLIIGGFSNGKKCFRYPKRTWIH